MSDKSTKAVKHEASAAPEALPEPTSGMPEALAEHMESLAEAKDLRGGLEVIKFLRMFIQDMPITEYRTVGWPESVEKFLTARGLAKDLDYVVLQSGLDSSSHVFKFLVTERSKRFLCELAGLRSPRGPSLADMLYCELTKEKSEGRDFAGAMAKRGIGGTMKSVKVCVARCTANVFHTIANAAREDWFTAEDDAIVEFARTQIDGESLRPDAMPVVPIAVAEMYARLKGTLGKRKSVFRLMPDIVKSAAARPISQKSYAPAGALATTPFAMLEKCIHGMSTYMAKDVGSFLAGNYDNGALVSVSSLFRIPGDDADSEISSFELATDPRKALSLVETAYEACYGPDLCVSVDNRSNISVPAGAKGLESNDAGSRIRDSDGDPVDKSGFGTNLTALCKYIDGKADEEILGGKFSDEDPRMVLTACMFISPFKPYHKVADSCISINSSPLGVSSVTVTDGAPASEADFDVAKAWFETVHGFLADPDTEDESVLTSKCYTKVEGVPDTMASAMSAEFAAEIRMFIAKASKASTRVAEAVSGMKQYRKRESAAPGGIHDSSRWVTQVISFVPDYEVTLGQFKEASESGKSNAPHMRTHTSENADMIDAFVDRAYKSGAETTSPASSPKTFVVALETNVNYEMLCKVTSEYGEFRLFDALERAFFKTMSSCNGFSAFIERMRSSAEGSSMRKAAKVIDFMRGAEPPPSYETGIMCGLRRDSSGRTVVMLSVPTYVALGLIGAACGDKYDVWKYAAKVDPSVITLSSGTWKKELGEILYRNRLLKNRLGNAINCWLPALGDWLARQTWYGGEIDSESIEGCLANTRRTTDAFRHLTEASATEVCPD